MNIIDLRKTLQASSTNQRLSDRRKNPYEYGSPEWLDYINKNGLECPTHDRRKANRRVTDRRQSAESPDTPEKPYQRIFLTPAEKKLLMDLYLGDLEDLGE